MSSNGRHNSIQVTGGSAGIGRAAALAFAANGARVAVMGRRKERLDAVVEHLPAGLAVVGDLDVAEDCKRAVVETVSAFGGLDILVNNGIFLSLSPPSSCGSHHVSPPIISTVPVITWHTFLSPTSMHVYTCATEHVPAHVCARPRIISAVPKFIHAHLSFSCTHAVYVTYHIRYRHFVMYPKDACNFSSFRSACTWE